MVTSTVVIRLEGPMQSWGSPGQYWDYRPTLDRPTKSGVLGLVANCLGRSRGDDVEDLAALRFAVRADKPGRIEHDYRTAGGGTFPLDARTRALNPKLDKAAGDQTRPRVLYGAPRGAKHNGWTQDGRLAVFRHATYLADAGFLASLTGDGSFLKDIHEALQYPQRLVFLGRRSNPPSQSLLHHVFTGDQHATWMHELPLLDTATTHTPRYWREDTAGDISYEQPILTPEGGHGPITLVTALTEVTHVSTRTDV